MTDQQRNYNGQPAPFPQSCLYRFQGSQGPSAPKHAPAGNLPEHCRHFPDCSTSPWKACQGGWTILMFQLFQKMGSVFGFK
jgi:hypothetical protein